MAVYYVDDGGSNTSPYDTWAKAATDLRTLDTAVAIASGDVIYVGHDSADSTSTTITLTGPTSDPPAYVVSATSGSSPPTYQIATAANFATSSGAVTFDGAFSVHGLRISAPGSIYCTNNAAESQEYVDCVFAPGDNQGVFFNSSAEIINCTVDCSADTTNRVADVVNFSANPGAPKIVNLAITNGGYRTGIIVDVYGGIAQAYSINGLDVSSCNNATTPKILDAYSQSGVVRNLKTASTYTLFNTSSRPQVGQEQRVQNYGPSDAPAALYVIGHVFDLEASTAIYRTGGAELNGVATAWQMTTESNCSEGNAARTPWLYGDITAAGSKTFDVYLVNDSADLTDAQAWLEVEYLDTSGSNTVTVATDHRVITTTPAAQTDDTSSTWNGTGPSFTYKQKLSVTATVGQAGQYRARVAIGKASVASGDYLFIDPKVTVS